MFDPLNERAEAIARKLHAGAWERLSRVREAPGGYALTVTRATEDTWARFVAEAYAVLVADRELP